MLSPNRFSWFLVASALLAGVLLGGTVFWPGQGIAQSRDPVTGGAPRYTVVFTEGTNLCVTDNHTKKLYFYTIDQGKEPGADLKLRAFVDLHQVGKDVIKPTMVKNK